MKIILDRRKNECTHKELGMAYDWKHCIVQCESCFTIVESKEWDYGWYWKKRSERWTNRQLKKMKK